MRRIRVADRARDEVRDLLRISRARFGLAAAKHYDALLRRAYKLLSNEPERPGVQRHSGLSGALLFFHIRHARTRGAAPKQARHMIVFTYDDKTLTIIRVLHDAMDVETQVIETPEG